MNYLYENQKFRGLRLNILFDGERYHVGEGYSAHNKFIGTFTPAEFFEWLPGAVERNALPAFRPPPEPPLDLDLDLDLNFDLDL